MGGIRAASEIVGLMDFGKMADNWVKNPKAGAGDWEKWYDIVYKALKGIVEPYRAKPKVTEEDKKAIQKKVGDAVRKASAQYRGRGEGRGRR